MDQYLLIPFWEGWTSIYQLLWCSPGVQGFDTLPYFNQENMRRCGLNGNITKQNRRRRSFDYQLTHLNGENIGKPTKTYIKISWNGQLTQFLWGKHWKQNKNDDQPWNWQTQIGLKPIINMRFCPTNALIHCMCVFLWHLIPKQWGLNQLFYGALVGI
jgi:hypothetical protein